jgi:hypothetical protein
LQDISLVVIHILKREGTIMKKVKIFILTFILIISSSIPAFAIDPTPIIIDPITILPMMPVFFNTKTVYSTPLYRLYKNDWDIHTYTSSSSERIDLISEGWTDEGIIAYVSPVDLPGYEALNRYQSFGRLVKLSTTPIPGLTWWHHTGTVGYIPPEPFVGFSHMHESVKSLSEGDMPWDSDYYYSSEFIQFGPWGKIPKIPFGYNFTGNTFNLWTNSTILQEISISDLPSNVSGGHKRTLAWSTLMAGGKIELLYSSDNGSTWNTIEEDIDNPTKNGSYQWTVPNITNSKMKVRILWMPAPGKSAAAWDTSNTFATTKDPGIITLIPIGPGIDILTIKPSAPTNLTANPGILTKKITLYWADNSANETSYAVERKVEGGFYSGIGLVGINETEYTDTSISTSVEYIYRVMAKGAILDSGYSNEAEAVYTGLVVKPRLPDGFIFPDFPDPPDNVTTAFTDGSNSEVIVSWNPPAGTYTGFKVERDAGIGWIELGNTTEDDHDFVDVDLTELSGVISYRVKTYDEALTSTPSYLASIDLGETEPPLPDLPAIFDGTQSGWAEPELIEAYENGLTYPGVMYDYGRSITREEFCTIAVKLYEKLTGFTAIPGIDPFDDTDNPDVLKAYKLGIVNGISETQFAPSNNITRQEMCVMIYRALGAARLDTSVDPTAPFPFTDADIIASWAIKEVKFCHQNGIMNGTSLTTIDPLLNTPREQAIVLINRTYNSFGS